MANWLTGYAYRKAITIDADLVNADLSYFPTLVSLVNDSSVGTHALSTGYDIRFTSYDGTTVLDYERESFVIGSGVCNAFLWVKVSALSSSSDTVIYLYYGKSDATDGQNINGVWNDGGSNNFKGVWHLKETGTGTASDYKDSTQYANHSTNAANEPTRVTGKIGYGQSFDGADQIIQAGTNASLAVQSHTLSGWIKLSEYSSVNSRMIASKSTSILNSGVEWGVNENGDLRFAYNDGGVRGWYGVTSVISLNTDYYISFVWVPGTLKVYINGSQSGNDITTTTGTIVYNSDVFTFGDQGNNIPWAGLLDEMRVSNTTRSPDWISAEYNNQNSPSSFCSLGSEESFVTLLTYKDKYIVQSGSTVTVSSAVMEDDTPATKTFTLAASQTVLVIYNANSAYGDVCATSGMMNGINVDGTLYSRMCDSGYAANYPQRNSCVWVGTLAAGEHTIKGQVGSFVASAQVTVSNRTLIIYIFDGNGYAYTNSTAGIALTGETFVNDTSASITVNAEVNCKILTFYGITNDPGTSEHYVGKKVCINVGGSDIAATEARKSSFASTSVNPDSVSTAYVFAATPGSYTVTARAASVYANSTYLSRRYFALLLLADSTLIDIDSSSDSQNTTSTSLVDDTTISSTRSTYGELLTLYSATKTSLTTSNVTGNNYGIMIDGRDVASVRASQAYAASANSSFVAFAQTVYDQNHTIEGRFSSNGGSSAAYITNRIMMSIWFAREVVSKSFTSNSDLLLKKPFSASSEVIIKKPFSGSNDIRLSKAFSSANDARLFKPFSTSSDLRVIKSFLGSSDVRAGVADSSSNEIKISKIFSSVSDLISYFTKVYASSTDISLIKPFNSNNDLRINSTISSGSDIRLSKAFNNLSDILAYYVSTFASSNEILVSRVFSGTSDLQLQSLKQSYNDVLVSKYFTSASDITAYLTALFSSQNDVRLSSQFSTNSDIGTLKQFYSQSDIDVVRAFASSDNIILYKTSGSSSDVDTNTGVVSTSDIQVVRAVSSDSDIALYKVYNSNNIVYLYTHYDNLNDVQLSKVFSSTNAILMSEVQKIFSSTNSILVDTEFVGMSDISAFAVVESENDIRASTYNGSENDIQASTYNRSENDIDLTSVFSSYNAILLANIQKMFQSSNKICINNKFENESNILLSVRNSYESNIRIGDTKVSSNDIKIDTINESTNSIFISTRFMSSSDIEIMIGKIFESYNNIYVTENFSSSEDINLSKVFSSINDVEIWGLEVLDYPLTVIVYTKTRTITLTPKIMSVSFTQKYRTVDFA